MLCVSSHGFLRRSLGGTHLNQSLRFRRSASSASTFRPQKPVFLRTPPPAHLSRQGSIFIPYLLGIDPIFFTTTIYWRSTTTLRLSGGRSILASDSLPVSKRVNQQSPAACSRYGTAERTQAGMRNLDLSRSEFVSRSLSGAHGVRNRTGPTVSGPVRLPAPQRAMVAKNLRGACPKRILHSNTKRLEPAIGPLPALPPDRRCAAASLFRRD